MLSNKFKHVIGFLIVCSVILLSCKKDDDNSSNEIENSKKIENYIYTVTYQDSTPFHPNYMKIIVYDKDYNKIWEKQLLSLPFGKVALILRNGTLFISSDKSLYAIDLKTGIFKWKQENSFGYFVQMAGRNDTIFYTHVGNYATLEAASALTGELYWQIPLSDSYGYANSSILDGNTFYFESAPFTCSHINAFDLTTKQIKWQTPCNSGGKLTLSNNNIYTLPPPGYLSDPTSILSLNTVDGKLNWSASDVIDYVMPQNSGYQNNLILLNNSDGYYSSGIRAIDPSNGSTIWTRFLEYTIYSLFADNRKIYFAGWEKNSAGSYYLVCADISSGNILWRHLFSVGGSQLNIFNKLIAYDNVVYGDCQNQIISSSGEYSYATMSFDANTGKLMDSAKISTSPLNYGGMNTTLNLVTESGELIGSNR